MRNRKRPFIQSRIVETLEREGASLLLLDKVAQIDPLVEAHIVSGQLAGGQLGPPQLSLSFGLGLKRLLLHQVQRFLVGHVAALHADVENGIGDHAQADLLRPS